MTHTHTHTHIHLTKDTTIATTSKKVNIPQVRGQLIRSNSRRLSTTRIYMVSVADFGPKGTISEVRVNPLPSKVLYTKKLHFSIGRLAQKQKTFSMCKLSVFESIDQRIQILIRESCTNIKTCQNLHTKVAFKNTHIVLHLLCCL